MPRNYDSIDLDWTFDGDFVIDHTGDLKDTSEDMLLSFKNEVLTAIKSNLKDWREDLNVGADIDEFIGLPNNQDTARALEQRVKSALLLIASESDLAVRVIPVGPYRVLITIQVQILATADNGRLQGDTLQISLLFDYLERGVFIPLDELNSLGGRVI